jgi:hypothetical protein
MGIFLSAGIHFGKLDDKNEPCTFDRANGFYYLLKEKLSFTMKGLFIASNPCEEHYEKHDYMALKLNR